MYFYDKSVSSYIKMLSKPITEQYLILRGVIPIDKVVWNKESKFIRFYVMFMYFLITAIIKNIY